MRIKGISVIIWVFLFGGTSLAQNGGYNHIGINLYPGFLIAHRDDSKNLEAHIMGYELVISKKVFDAGWSNHYSKPEIGFGAMFMRLGQPDLTGDVFAILPSFTTTFATIGRTEFRFKAGTGVGYLTQKFDAFNNRRNQAIGSNLNGAMQLFALINRQPVGKSPAWNAGIGLTHFSNGSFRVPNLGINMPSLHFGLSFDARSEHIPRKDDSLEFRRWNISLAYAFKERTLTKPKGFHIYNATITRLTRVSGKNDWRLGSDIFIDKTHHYLDYPGESLEGLNPLELTELGLFGGRQWLVGKVHFKMDVGFYAYKPSKNKFFTYQRLGFDYHYMQNAYLTFNLKTHFGIADHFTWGIGYRL